MTAGVYEFRDLVFITYPSIEIIELKVSILLDHLLFSGLKKEQFALGNIVHACDTYIEVNQASISLVVLDKERS